MWAKVKNGNVVKTVNSLRDEYPNTSFPKNITQHKNWYKVTDNGADHTVDQRIKSNDVEMIDGVPTVYYIYEDVPESDVNNYKQQMYRDVDNRAEQERLKYITNGSGQSLVYRQKEWEAKQYLNDLEDMDPSTPNIDDYPHIKSEIGITAETPLEVATIIATQAYTWLQISAYIEAKRLHAKNQITNSSLISEINTIMDDLDFTVPGA